MECFKKSQFKQLKCICITFKMQIFKQIIYASKIHDNRKMNIYIILIRLTIEIRISKDTI